MDAEGIDWRDLEAIKRLKYKYMRCLDQKLWDEVGSCFTEDATAAYSGGKYSAQGRDAIVDFLRRSMSSEKFLSSHRVHHPEIDFQGPDQATGIWALEDTDKFYADKIDLEWQRKKMRDAFAKR